MTDVCDETTVTCGCCGQPRDAAEVARLGGHPEIGVCGACVHRMAARLANRPSITPIFPVHDMAAARDFWTRTGLRVREYGPEYAVILYGEAEVLHLDLREGLDPERNAAACYVHVPDPHEWHRRWAAQGLPVGDVAVQPSGMVEFSVRDPSGNLVRLGRNG